MFWGEIREVPCKICHSWQSTVYMRYSRNWNFYHRESRLFVWSNFPQTYLIMVSFYHGTATNFLEGIGFPQTRRLRTGVPHERVWRYTSKWPRYRGKDVEENALYGVWVCVCLKDIQWLYVSGWIYRTLPEGCTGNESTYSPLSTLLFILNVLPWTCVAFLGIKNKSTKELDLQKLLTYK